MKYNIDWQGLRVVSSFIIGISGWIFGFIKWKENNGLRKEKNKTDLLDIDESLTEIEIENQRIMHEFDLEYERKQTDISARGLTYSGIGARELQNVVKERDFKIAKLETKKKKLQELRKLKKKEK